MKKPPRLCNFNKVELTVPRLQLLRLLKKKTFLKRDEFVFTCDLLREAEAADNKIRHVISILEKILLKARG